MLLCRAEFEQITEGLSDALDFTRTIGARDSLTFEQGGGRGVLGEVDFYTR
jgi:3-deoxy-7-phosphoheptulonate synthase